MSSQAQKWLEKQIKRVGMGAGTGQDWQSRAILVSQDANHFTLYNDFDSARLPWDFWQEVFKSLPDGAGHVEFWSHPLVLEAPSEPSDQEGSDPLRYKT